MFIGAELSVIPFHTSLIEDSSTPHIMCSGSVPDSQGHPNRVVFRLNSVASAGDLMYITSGVAATFHRGGAVRFQSPAPRGGRLGTDIFSFIIVSLSLYIYIYMYMYIFRKRN